MENCEISQKCGGCNIHQTSYEEQLKEKTEYVRKLVKNELNNKIIVKKIIGMENPYNYRNKGKFVFGTGKSKQPMMGFYEDGTQLDYKTILTLKNVKLRKIVYNSCNPITLMHNLKVLNEFYEINEIQPVDMFPWTSHVECVALMGRK